MTKIPLISGICRRIILLVPGWLDSQDNSRIMQSESLSLQRQHSHRILAERAFKPDTSTRQLARMTDVEDLVGIVSWSSSASNPCCPIRLRKEMLCPGICQDIEVSKAVRLQDDAAGATIRAHSLMSTPRQPLSHHGSQMWHGTLAYRHDK